VPDSRATGGIARPRRHHEQSGRTLKFLPGEEDQESLPCCKDLYPSLQDSLADNRVGGHVEVGHDTPRNPGDYSAL
jgi:hypothetical protein